VVTGSALRCHAKSLAIYAGENPEIPRIQNAIHLHLAPTKWESIAQPQGLLNTRETLKAHLIDYSNRSLQRIKESAWEPSSLCSEAADVATALGRAIVGAPELQQKLASLLEIEDDKRLANLSNTFDSLVLDAILNLVHKDKVQFRAGEIAEEANRIAKERGERLTYTAEKVGHLLKKLGLYTRRLGKHGRGLVMDRAMVIRVHELARLSGSAGLEPSEENLHCPHCSETKEPM
jgi:hypothetical protein